MLDEPANGHGHRFAAQGEPIRRWVAEANYQRAVTSTTTTIIRVEPHFEQTVSTSLGAMEQARVERMARRVLREGLQEALGGLGRGA